MGLKPMPGKHLTHSVFRGNMGINNFLNKEGMNRLSGREVRGRDAIGIGIGIGICSICSERLDREAG